MKRPEKRDMPHIVLTALSWGVFAVCLIRFLAAYGSLDEEIGIHFAGDGSFDVTDKKIFGFYPFLVSVITLVICVALNILVKKIKVSNKVTEKGGELMRFGVRAYIDLCQLCMVLFFSGVWSDCVIRQHPLDTDIPAAFLFVLFGLFFVLSVYLIAVKTVCRDKSERS